MKTTYTSKQDKFAPCMAQLFNKFMIVYLSINFKTVLCASIVDVLFHDNGCRFCADIDSVNSFCVRVRRSIPGELYSCEQ